MSIRLLPFTAERLLDILNSQPAPGVYLVGFSGGADSTALLYALVQIRNQLESPISAVHINHGIHADADKWQQHCEQFCKQHDVSLVNHKVTLTNQSGLGLEAEARQLRYAALSASMEPGDCLLVAHHADDQAETMVLNLMRGSGVDGLSAMPHSRSLAAGVLQRPLLGFTNSELVRYLQNNNIVWLEDPSNQSTTQDRSFIRHEILPMLEARWQGVSKRLLLTQTAMSEARTLLEGLADNCLAQNLQHAFVLQVSTQLSRDPALFKLTIRRWLKQAVLPPIPARSLDSLYQQVCNATREHQVCIRWGGVALRYYQQRLWLLTSAGVLPCPLTSWSENSASIDLGDECGSLTLEGPLIERGALDLTVSGRHECEHDSIRKGGQHLQLKNLFQDAGIPSWLRECIPLCSADGRLVAVGDWCIEDRFAVWMAQNGIKLTWRPQNPLLQFIVRQQRTTDHE